MAKSKKSKILASVLAVSTMAVFYAAPVFATQEGLTTNGEDITAASSVTINGVTLTGNDLSAVDGTFTGAVTAKGFTSNNGAIYVKNADATNVFTADTRGNVTAAGAVTAASLSTRGNATVGGTLTANAKITGKNGLDIDAAVNENGTSGNLDIAAGSNSMKATYVSGDSTFTNTITQKNGTTITATRQDGDDVKTSTSLTLNGVSATLKAGSASVGVNGETGNVSINTRNADGYGTFTVTSSNFAVNTSSMAYKNTSGESVFTVSNGGNVKAEGTLTADGKVTGNNGLDINTAANDNGTSGSLDIAAGSNSMKATYVSGDSTFTNTLSQSKGTTITATRQVGSNAATSTSLTLNGINANLTAGNTQFTTNAETGAIGITAKASNGAEGALTVKSSNFDTAATATTVTAASGANSASSKTAYNEIEDTITNGTNTTTSTMNANGITDSFTTGTVTATSTINAKGITDTFTDANGTHSVTTDGNGTKFTGPTNDNKYNYTTIDGNTATFGGTKNASYGGQTVISGGSVTTNSVTTGSLTIDENNGWTEDGLTIDGVTVTTKDGSLAVGALAIDNVQLDETGLKLGETGNEKFTVDSATGETHINGTYGSLNMKDIGESTMIYTKANDERGTNTIWIDTAKGNINTIGTIGVGADLAKPTTIIDGTSGDISVGVNGEEAPKINLNASKGTITAKGGFSAANGQFVVDATTGNVKAANVNGVTLATDGTNVEVGGYNVAQMSTDIDVVEGKIGGIRRAGTTDENRSTYIEETVQVNNNSGLAVLDEERNVVARVDRSGRANFTALTVDGSITSGGALTVKNENGTASLSSTALNIGDAVTVRNDGIARFGALNGANVRVEKGVLTVNSTGETDVAKLDAQGLTLTSGATEATLSAEQIARLNTVVTQNGESIVVTADHFKNTNNSFAVDSNGAVRAADGKFNVGADGDVAIQYAKDGAIVADKNGFAVQKGSAQTVVTNVGVANIYDDNRVEVNANGVGLAAGLKADGSAAAQINVTDDGIGLQGGTSEVVLNSNNGAVFTNGEGNGETVINGDSITTNRITTGTVNGVAIGMNDDGDITLGNNVVIDGDFNSDNIAGITRVDLNDSEPGSEVTYIEKNTAVSADGIVVTDPNTGVSTKTKYDGFYVKDETGNNVSILRKDKLVLAGKKLAVADSEGNIDVSASTYTAGDATAENVRVKSDGIYVKNGSEILNSLTAEGLTLGEQQLTEEKISYIGGIDRSYDEETKSYTTTIEKALSISDDGSFATTNGSFSVDAEGNLYSTNGTVTVQTRENLAAVQLGQTTLGMSDEDITMSVGRGTAIALSKYTGINLSSGGNNIALNSDGAVFTNDNIEGSTVIKGGSVTTGTITADDLHVDNIYLGNQIVDEEGNVVGSDLAIGADGSIKIADNFEVDTDNLAAHYVGEDYEYELTLDGTNGFALRNSEASLTLNGNGYAFSGPVNLGAASDVKFGYTDNLGGYTGSSYSLSQLVDTVNDIYDRTSGIYKDADGNTVVTDGTWNAESKKMEEANSSITVGKDGATFESTTNEGATNINGGAIDADSSSIGNDVSGGSGSGSSGMTGDGTYTDGSEHSGHFVDKDSSYEFTNDANGFTGTVTDGKHTTTIENGSKGSNTTVKGDNTSASSGVGIGNDGAFISDSVTNGDISHTVNGGSITDTVTNGNMTVTEVKDENGSATTVKDANGSSTVSQDTNGQTVSTGTGTSVNTGNDFSVTDNEGKSIYMSDIGHVEDIDSEIQNSDGSKTTVVDAVNNEAEIRRNEIERVDGRINNLENRVGELEDRIDKVGAMAAAIANLRTMGYDPAAPTEVAVGIGQYRDETGAALGLFHYPNRDFMLSLSVSTSGDEVMGGIGATWKFGRKSPEKVAEIKKAQAEADARRAEEAKLAKAEEMKQAAKEAKIKAQQERHAKLAAERAAQAEAAK